MAAIGLGLAAISYAAVPRLKCDWEIDFCSDYGPVYAGLAAGFLILSALLLLVFRWASKP